MSETAAKLRCEGLAKAFPARGGTGRVAALEGVELEVGADGALTGALVGPNVRGPEKEVRLRAWLDGDEPDLLWAYGNSSGDRELLAMADVPVWVDRRSHRPPAV